MRHTKKLLILLLVAVMSVSLGVLACAPAPAPTPAPAEPEFHWRYQVAYAASDGSFLVEAEGIARLIEEASEGRIKVDTYPVGALVAPEEIFSAVLDGAIELGLNLSSAEGEMIPSAYTLSLTGASQDLSEAYELVYNRGLFEIVQEAYQELGVHYLVGTFSGRIVLSAQFKANSWDAFEGTKGWATPPTQPVLTELGAVCVAVPGYDMYSAMKLGTIDWYEWTIAELETLGWKEVVQSVLISPITMIGVNNTLVNREAWEAIGPELQQKIQSALIDNVMDLGLQKNEMDDKAIAAAKEYGVEIVEMSEADKARFIIVCAETWDYTAEMSPRAAESVRIAKEYLRSLGRL